MFQVPVNNLERIRRARKKVKGILLDIGLESCRELLQEINSCGPGENCFSSTSWADLSLWESTGRRKKYRTKPFCCSLCNFSSKLPASLKNHLHRSHEEELDQELVVPCPSCVFSSQSKTVVKHMRLFHTSVRKLQSSAVNNSGGVSLSQSKKDVIFTCLKCSFRDTLYYSMKKHVLVTHFGNIFGAYFGEKPDSFTETNEYATLMGEQNSHLFNKYYCKKCHTSTSTPDALVCHILTAEKHRDLEYELRTIISEFHRAPARKSGSSKLIAPKSYTRKLSASEAAVSAGVPMPNPACVQLVSFPQHNTNPLLMGQSTAALQNTVRQIPVVSNSPGGMLHTSPVSVMAQSHHGYLPNSIPVSQNMSLQSSLSQPIYVSQGFPMNQSVRPGLHPGNHAITSGVLPHQFSRPGMFSSHPSVRPGFLPHNQSVHGGGLPMNQSITSGGFPLNHSVSPGLFTVNQSARPGYFTPNQSVRPQTIHGAQPSGSLPANKYVSPGVPQDNNFMGGGNSLLRQLIPTGKQVNGIPTYTLGPVPVNLPASPGGAGTPTPPQVPMQLTQSNTVAQISRSPASAPSPPVINASQNMPDLTTRLPILSLAEKNTKQWKTCPVCSELFPSNVYQVHMQVAHKQLGIMQAKEKDKVDQEKLAARAPFLRWVKEKVVRCLSCKCFVSEEELMKHLMMHGIVCLFCTWTFHDLKSFVDHNKTVHNGKKKMHVDYIQKGLQLANDAHGNILFPHFDFNTKMPKEQLGEKDVHLAVLAGANSKALVPVYIKVQLQATDVGSTCVKPSLKCPFCLSAFAGLEVYETHLKDRHHIMPTLHTILKTPAFKCIHCCGVYTGNMTLAAISVHLLRCRSAPKDSSSGIEFLTHSNGENIQPVRHSVPSWLALAGLARTHAVWSASPTEISIEGGRKRRASMAEGDQDSDVLQVDENERPSDANLQAELQMFRARWMSELAPGVSSSGQDTWARRTSARGPVLKATDTKGKQELAKEEKARELFLKAAEQEQNGALYEAIKLYRRAMQLVPDIEFKINYAWSSDGDGVGKSYMEDTDDESNMADLLSYFQQQLTFQESSFKMCQPELDFNQTHISVLPMEVLVYIFRWVVSSDLDLRSLEQLSLVCKGFYICARDPEIWRLACLKIWGRNCNKPIPYITWRQMFLERPRVRFDGVYISKTTYIRQGEQSLDGFYRAWHQVEYYRYMRFFSDGLVMMLTTPEEPQSIVHRLRTRNPRTDAILFGHYRLSQETDNQTKVFAVIMKKKEEKPLDFRYRYIRRAPVQEIDHSFHIGLQLCSSGRQKFNKLVWIHHSCHITYKSTGETAVTAFEIDKTYAPLFFARVKSFTAFSERPL